MLPVVPDDGVNKFPANSSPCKEKVPSAGARLGWYNLVDDVLVSTAANAIPPGFDEIGNEAYYLQRDHQASWCPHWRELVVDAVIADQKGNRYVNVVELAAARLNNNNYIIRGRIEKSSWRNQGDTWVNLLKIKKRPTGNSFFDSQAGEWLAKPVDAEAATANEVEAPTMTFDTWKEGYMKKFLEGEEQQHQANREVADAQRAAATRTICIHYSNKQAAEDALVADMGCFRSESHAAVKIVDGKFTPNPEGGGPNGEGRTFNEAQASSAKTAFDASSYTAWPHDASPCFIHKNGKNVLKIEDGNGTKMDETTLACAMVVLGLIR